MSRLVVDILNDMDVLSQLNYMLLVLILKIAYPIKINDFHLMSHCVIYNLLQR